ncbi:MAG: LysR substrate-binding domain-containing protein [Bradymonadia bacterium]
MDRLEAMQLFTRVVERQSFTAVAREVGSSQPTVSRRIAELEAHLGARLLHRTTRHITPTDEGARYYQTCKRLIAELDAVESEMGRRQQAVEGVIKVACPAAFGRLVIMTHLPAFMAEHPGVQVELSMSDQVVDLVASGIDLAVRIGQLTDNALKAVRVGRTQRIAIAESTYLDRRGRPSHPHDLVHHDCVVFNGSASGPRWRFEGPEGIIEVPVKGRVSTDSAEAIRAAALSGLGVALAPSWLFCSEPDGPHLAPQGLETVLDDWLPPALPMHVVYPEAHRLAPRHRAFIDFFKARFSEIPTVRR